MPPGCTGGMVIGTEWDTGLPRRVLRFAFWGCEGNILADNKRLQFESPSFQEHFRRSSQSKNLADPPVSAPRLEQPVGFLPAALGN